MPPPPPYRSRLQAQSPVAAAHTVKIRTNRRILHARKDIARPNPRHNPQSARDAAMRPEFVSPPAGRAPTAPHREPLARTNARSPAKQQDSPQESKASVCDPL